ncbi:MAG: hypothetical protein U9R41_00785 [Candidatus Marinimicrobia bacterium]|nr:hypothetical protein [Candidatus Neomarinimicrobiota bacterium]
MIKSLDDFKVYQLAMDLGEEIWKIVVKWNYSRIMGWKGSGKNC